MNTDLHEVIDRALKIKELNNLPFVTIWKTGRLFGFNFDHKPKGFVTNDYGVKRVVIGVY